MVLRQVSLVGSIVCRCNKPVKQDDSKPSSFADLSFERRETSGSRCRVETELESGLDCQSLNGPGLRRFLRSLTILAPKKKKMY